MIESWKPLLTALAMPPAPLLALALIGAWQHPRRPRLARALVLLAAVLLWLSCTSAAGVYIERQLLGVPPALTAKQVEEIRQRVAQDASRVAIVALGGGMRARAPELDAPDLADRSYMRLRYAARLARETGAPLGFSGGTGWAQSAGRPDAAEARIAARLAKEEFGLQMRWVEPDSRDTRENAALILPMLAQSGVREVVLVTSAWHMRRSVRAFETAAAPLGIEIVPAPTAYANYEPRLRWLPSGDGYTEVRQGLRELLGYALGR